MGSRTSRASYTSYISRLHFFYGHAKPIGSRLAHGMLGSDDFFLLICWNNDPKQTNGLLAGLAAGDDLHNWNVHNAYPN